MRGESWTENAFFEWSGRPDDAREEPQGEWVIGAGASWKLGAEPDEDDHRHWYAEARRQGFELGSGPHAIYLFRYLRLDELPGGETLSDQARGLAEWVLNTWDLLDERPPVASAALPNPDHLVNDVVDEQGVPLPPGRTIDESDPPRQRPSDAPPLQT